MELDLQLDLRGDATVSRYVVEPNPFQRDIDHWNETGKCLRHFSIDTPPLFCEQCGKRWTAVMDGREGRKRRRERRP